MKNRIRWGILGCGNIAQKFVSDLQYVDKAILYAIASNNQERRERFAETYNARKIYTNYESLVNDENVDIVYIATTHNFHYSNALLCLNANKPVLCEKPLCINSKEAQVLINIAKKNKVFFMEAMWTRFFPLINHLKKDLISGIIGRPKFLQADFGIKKPPAIGSRFYEKELGAGSLLDLGVYTINFSNLIFDSEPSEINGFTKLNNQGIDEHTTCNLKYSNGEIAQLSATISFITPHEARIYGHKGKIVVSDFYHPQEYSIFLTGGGETRVHKPFKGFGYHFEAVEAQNCLLSNKQESEIFPLENSLNVLTIMDSLRKQLGIVYPNDKSI